MRYHRHYHYVRPVTVPVHVYNRTIVGVGAATALGALWLMAYGLWMLGGMILVGSVLWVLYHLAIRRG